MGSEVLPSVDAVTAVEDSEGRVVLLGLGEAAFDRRVTQTEALWNSHHIRANNIEVDDVARNVGGGQCIKMTTNNGNRITIPMKFNGSIMTVDVREPTEEELLALGVNWLTPPMEEITPQSIRRSKVALQTHITHIQQSDHSVTEPEAGKGKRTVKEWKKLLAYPSDLVVE